MSSPLFPGPFYFFAAICERRRSSCSLSSGVNSAPKSSASNTWRISISDSPGMSLGPGSRITEVIDVGLPRPRDLADPRSAQLFKKVEGLLA